VRKRYAILFRIIGQFRGVGRGKGAKMMKGMEETYGNAHIPWNLSKEPVGRPVVSILP
jgi:hypothetical protein